MSAHGNIVEYESHKIKNATLSTTVAELYAFQKVFGTATCLRGLWCDIACEAAPLHMRTDANNLVTTASSTRLPEQKETLHMIQTLRREAMSGSIDDLAHVRTEDMLADCLTKSSVKPDVLIQAASTGVLPNVDTHPEFRSLLKHKAFLVARCAQNLHDVRDMIAFCDEQVDTYVHAFYSDRHAYASMFLHTQLFTSAVEEPSGHIEDACELNTCD